MELRDFQEDLGKETLLSEKARKAKISSGIRELDEMVGGGFTPASLNLIQEELGCGADILAYCIAKANLTLSNKVLVIFSDPLSKYLVEKLKEFDESFSFIDKIKERPENESHFKGIGQEAGKNLFILDLVALSEKDITIMEDKHEIQLKISTAISQMLKDIETSKDDFSEKFIIYFSLNPFLLKLGGSTLDLLYNSLIEATSNNYVQIVFMQKNLITKELTAKIQSLCHLVCDLNTMELGDTTENHIKILKHAGTVHDLKAEPYVLDYDREHDKYSFLIRGAFLTSFETLRNLLKYENGSISLAKIPYLLAPVEYFNDLLEMPLNLTMEGGKREIHEKSQATGRMITNMTKALYYLSDIDLFKATLRNLALFGFGDLQIDVYEKEENLMILTITFQKAFHERSYEIFMKGLMEGIVRRALKRSIRSVRIIKIEKDIVDKFPNRNRYKIIIRLSSLVD